MSSFIEPENIEERIKSAHDFDKWLLITAMNWNYEGQEIVKELSDEEYEEIKSKAIRTWNASHEITPQTMREYFESKVRALASGTALIALGKAIIEKQVKEEPKP